MDIQVKEIRKDSKVLYSMSFLLPHFQTFSMPKLQRRNISVIKHLNSSMSLLLILIICNLPQINGHGRLIEPPSRASAWRYGFATPANYVNFNY